MNPSKFDQSHGALHSCSKGRGLWRLLPALCLVLLTGCRGTPSINLLGSFFPGWMLAAGLGVAGAFGLRQVFIKTEVEPYLRPRALVYVGLWVLITLSAWLLFFRS